MLHQFLEKQDFKKENLYPGLRQAFWGVFKKTFIADPLSYAIDPVFASPGSYDSYAIWLVACLFSVQIYCDFSGYSDIAIGTGRILGFDIPKNFIRPFLSGTISELWRRWHISFSSWIRDYVYITLGGNKRGVFLSYVNLFVTMFVSGIWHGADWNYIIWGFCHAGFMVFERFIFKFKAIENGWNRVPYYLRPLYPFLIFSFSMLYFRAKPLEGFSNSAAVGNFMVQHGFSGFNGLFPEIPIALYVLIGVLFFVEILQNKKEEIFDSIMNRPIVLYSTCAILYLVSIIIYSVTKSQPFVYFQF
jgi:D-alanyl-lipoteichoic acid acyltransferase DltB (MBOAT superfamily)